MSIWSDARIEPVDLNKKTLMRVDLGAGEIHGLNVMTPRTMPTNGVHAHYHYDRSIYDGILFVGAGSGQTRIRSHAWGNTVTIGNGAGIVAFQDVTLATPLNGNKTMIVQAGFSREHPNLGNTHFRPDDLLVLFDVVLDSADTWAQGYYGWQGVSTYNFGLQEKGTVARCKYLHEHTYYHRGYSSIGIYSNECEIESSGAEGRKHTQRPHECWWSPDACAYYRKPIIRDWGQPWSWQGGAGMTFQGAGLKTIMLEQHELYGRSFTHKPCVAIDDGMVVKWAGTSFQNRYYDQNGVPGGPGWANGYFLMLNGGLSADGSAKTTPLEIINVMPTWRNGFEDEEDVVHTPPPHDVTAGVWIRSNAVYGANTTIGVNAYNPDEEIQDCHRSDERGFQFIVDRSNTDDIAAFAEREGFDTAHETMIRANGAPVSAGISP